MPPPYLDGCLSLKSEVHKLSRSKELVDKRHHVDEGQCDHKKSPNIYKKLPKKWKIYIDTFTKYA